MVSKTWFAVAVAPMLLLIPHEASAQARDECRQQQVQTGVRGHVSFGGTLLRSSIDENKLNTSLFLTYYPGASACVVPRWRTLLTVQADYSDKAKDQGELIVARHYRADAQQMRLFADGSAFMAAAARFRHNNAQGIELQQLYTVTTGMRLPFLHGLEVAAGPGWSDLHLADDSDVGYWGAAVGESGSWLIVPSLSLLFTQGARAFFPVQDEGSTRYELFGDLLLPITGPVEFGASIWFDRLEDPPAGFEEDYVSTTARIKFSF